jgi:hypothetical protein
VRVAFIKCQANATWPVLIYVVETALVAIWQLRDTVEARSLCLFPRLITPSSSRLTNQLGQLSLIYATFSVNAYVSPEYRMRVAGRYLDELEASIATRATSSGYLETSVILEPGATHQLLSH